MIMKTLDEIGLVYRTDKSSPYHNYLNTYEQYFREFRNRDVIVWELGIGDINSENREGESGLMWRDYFYNAIIQIFDNDPVKVKRFDNITDRIGAYCIDQTDLEGFKKILTLIPPSIIIDDASHIQSNTIRSFEILFPILKPGGLYCIEDSVTNYWRDWGGDPDIFGHNPNTIMNYMFRLCHIINLKRQETFNPPQSYKIEAWEEQIDSIHFHHSQIIIKKKI